MQSCKRMIRSLSPSACLPFQARGKAPDQPLVAPMPGELSYDSAMKTYLVGGAVRDTLLGRCRSLIELLEMKVMVAQHKWGGEH